MAQTATTWLDRNANRLVCALIASALVVPVPAWVVRSAMEARAFNHVTGRNVSTWDAMWLELRVDSN